MVHFLFLDIFKNVRKDSTLSNDFLLINGRVLYKVDTDTFRGDFADDWKIGGVKTCKALKTNFLSYKIRNTRYYESNKVKSNNIRIIIK